jgi:hypothetical protein
MNADIDQLLATQFAPTRGPADTADWADVLRRAGLQRKRRPRRLMAAVGAVAALVVVVVATPAFGVGHALRDLFEGTPPTPDVIHDFESWNASRGWQPGQAPSTSPTASSSLSSEYPAVDPQQAHGLISVQLPEGPAFLWAAPLPDGRECAIFETTGAQGSQQGASWGGGQSECASPTVPSPPALFGENARPSDIEHRVLTGKAPGASTVVITFADETTTKAPVVEGFFMVAVTGPLRSLQTTATDVRSYDANGNLIADTNYGSTGG